jgi:hypothetical protein
MGDSLLNDCHLAGAQSHSPSLAIQCDIAPMDPEQLVVIQVPVPTYGPLTQVEAYRQVADESHIHH